MQQVQARRRELRRAVEVHERLIANLEAALARRERPVMNWLRRSGPDEIEDRLAAQIEEVDSLRRQLDDAVVEANFHLDDAARKLFAEAARRFDVLRPARPGDAVSSGDPMIASPVTPLHLHHPRGRDVLIFPWFVAVASAGDTLVPHDIRQLFVSTRAKRTGGPETDDGGGVLLATLPNGFDEAWRFDSHVKCEAFAAALDAYVASLPALPPPEPAPATTVTTIARAVPQPAPAAPPPLPPPAVETAPAESAALDIPSPTTPAEARESKPPVDRETEEPPPGEGLLSLLEASPPEPEEPPPAIDIADIPWPPDSATAAGREHWAEPLPFSGQGAGVADSPPAATGRPADGSAAHWAEPLSPDQIAVWPVIRPRPVSTPPASPTPPDITAAPASPAPATPPAATAKTPGPSPLAGIRRAVVASWASAHGAMAPQLARGLASLRDLATRQVGQLRTRRINNPPQPASRTTEPIRAQRSVPPLSAVQRGNRTGLVLAAGIVLAGALAATSPLLWPKDPVPAALQGPAASPGPEARTGMPQAAAIPAGTQGGPPPAADPPLPPSPAAPAQTLPSTTELPPRPTATAPAEPLTYRQVLQLQDRLRMLGFNPGRSDGVVGPRTIAAIREFQAAHGFPVTGVADTKLLEDVLFIQAATMSKPGTR